MSRLWPMLCVCAALAACGREKVELVSDPAVLTLDQPAAPFAPEHIDHGGGVYEPAPGDPERKALLDALRPKVVVALGTPVEFAITTLRVKDDWAFAVVEPAQPGGGGALTIAETRRKGEEGEWDGLRTEAIWRKKNAGWTVEQYAIGAADVWYEPYCDTAPKGLIPICGIRAAKP